jgi:Protein of unknown function (DUF3759)
MVFGWGKPIESSVPRSPLLPTAVASPSCQLLTILPIGEAQQSYDQVQNGDVNESSFSHEALAGAASFGAFKMFEDRQRKEGTS